MIFRKLVNNSNATSRALAANSINAVIPKTHASVNVGLNEAGLRKYL